MKQKNLKVFNGILFVITIFLFLPRPTQAVPPPEIIYGTGAIAWQLITLVSVVITGALVFLKKYYSSFRAKILLGIIFVFILGLGIEVVTFSIERKSKKIAAAFTKTIEPADPANAIPLLDFNRLTAWKNAEKEFILYDARVQEEYETGHFKGAVLWDSWGDNYDFPDAAKTREQALLTDSSVPVVFYCDGGYRSGRLAREFKKYHDNTYILEVVWGGLKEDHWEKFWFGGLLRPQIVSNTVISEKEFKALSLIGATVLDTRPSGEYADSPRENNIHIPVQELTPEATRQMVKNLNRSGDFIIVCKIENCFLGYILKHRICPDIKDDYCLSGIRRMIIFPVPDKFSDMD